MVVNVGVVGTGMIGRYHCARLTDQLANARVAAVFDLDTDRAEQLAEQVGATAHDELNDLIRDRDVEAILVTTPPGTHADMVRECIAAGKPVLTEKPLATNGDDALEVLSAEVDHGSRLVQVGFMRRYDRGYRQVKSVIEDGLIGEPLLVHNVHRGPAAPDHFTSEMVLTDAVVHEIDANRWLLGEEFVATHVIRPKRTPHAAEDLQDPQLVILETTNGIIAEIEMFANAQYGYDVRCEVVGSEGTVDLETPSASAVRRGFQHRRRLPEDWRERFDGAFHNELQQWIDGLIDGSVSGPSAWDGYAATVVTNACVAALDSGDRVEIALADKPPLYA